MAHPEYTTTSTLADWLSLSERQVYRLTADGVLPKPRRRRRELKGGVKAYIGHLQAILKSTGNGRSSFGGAAFDADPDKLPLDDRVRYYRAIRLRQQTTQHLEEIAAALAEEYRRQAQRSMQIVRDALEDADLPQEKVNAIRRAITRATDAALAQESETPKDTDETTDEA